MRHREVPVSRRTVLGGIGIGAIGVTMGASGNAAAAQQPTASATFGSFNIHHGASPDDVMDLERVAMQIEAMGCDVIGLQEVDRFWERSDYIDEPAWLAKRLGMHVAFGSNLDLDPDEPGKPRREYGTAVLSRWEITQYENILLPRVDDHEQRGLLRAVVAAPEGSFTFATTHLSFEDVAEQVAQAQKVLKVLGVDPQRTVLVGDFNAEPGAESIDVITGSFMDAWVAVGDGDGLTYPSVGPDSRIDFVFASPDLTAETMAVADEDPEASDHLPIHGLFAVGTNVSRRLRRVRLICALWLTGLGNGSPVATIPPRACHRRCKVLPIARRSQD